VPSPTANAGNAAVTSLQALADLCAKHEERVREVSLRREETFKRLQGSMGSALEQIEACRRKNESLSRRLEDMDRLIDEERSRWMSQVDAVAKGLELGS
jgi:HPt (histidine-containing phosphotransfer) domain-containing protein